MNTSSRWLQTLLVSLALLVIACGDSATTSDATDVMTDVLVDTSVDATDADATDTVDDVDVPSDTAADVATDADVDTRVDADATADAGQDTGPDVVVVPCDFSLPAGAFDGHTVDGFERVDCLFEWGDTGASPVQVKFVMTGFGVDSAAPVRFLDSRFYQLHDEWYWFHLLNNQALPSLPVAPVTGFSFATIADIYVAFIGASDLPLDLRWLFNNSRLYSPRFYDFSLDYGPPYTNSNGETITPDREEELLAVGSVLYYAPNPDRVFPDAVWAFELEFQHKINETELHELFTRLIATLPDAVGPQLRFLARSAQQEEFAAMIADGDGPWRDRMLSYDDLVVAGEIVGYNPGITAGFLKIFPTGTFSPVDVGRDTLAILERTPDDIPPVAGITTAVPQTALAHINLLAASRGTPNAYIAGVMDQGLLGDWAWQNRKVIYKVTDDDAFFRLMTNDQWDTYNALRQPPDRAIPQVDDLASAPLFVDLTSGGLADMAARVPLIGGKSAGFLAFVDFPAMTTPDAPLALTIKAYDAHTAALRPTLQALMSLAPIQTGDVNTADFNNDRRVRYVLLEGADAYAELSANDPAALAWLQVFRSAHQGASTPFGTLLDGGGLVQIIRDTPLDATFEAALRTELETRFAHLAPSQGLRFRSSATAEDAPGFNGAGLYDSNTGFLMPELQPAQNDKKKSIGWALKKTWASYWGFQATEERHVARITHLDGNMGVTIHPRFDDPLERANGVITFSLTRWTDPPTQRMVINVQDGAVSVTNPTGGSLPEIDVTDGATGAVPAITRAQSSTIVEPGVLILSDAELLTIHGQVAALADAWLDQANDGRHPAEQAGTVTLDLEFKKMADGWPALASGATRPGDFIYKQVRVLDSAQLVGPQVPANLNDPFAFIPQDVGTVARTVSHSVCDGPQLHVELSQVATDPGRAAMFPFADTPLLYRARFQAKTQPDGWSLSVGPTWSLFHTHMVPGTSTTPSGDQRIALQPQVAAQLGFDTLTISAAAGSWTLTRDAPAASLSGVFAASCTVEQLYQSPAQYLEGILAESVP